MWFLPLPFVAGFLWWCVLVVPVAGGAAVLVLVGGQVFPCVVLWGKGGWWCCYLGDLWMLGQQLRLEVDNAGVNNGLGACFDWLLLGLWQGEDCFK